ncbi:DinB family protein [Paenibacillus dokdonensis]|uniref:DinB family protein n=1 Tax=Paenibacillus dokdonensis TaxID=2567944 RepID=UPI0010A89FDD|nr:DinB family protein [Paenibacillus dokdonensis]
MSFRPASDEYNTYFERYISLVPEGDIADILDQSLHCTSELFSKITDEQGDFRYAPGKWSLKEVLGHISDNERIMSYRLLRIARGDQTPLSGYDQDDLMNGAAFDACRLSDLLEEYKLVRRSTLALLRGLPKEAWSRMCIVDGHESSARAWAYIIAGHELHHLKVIRDKYQV